MEIKLIRHDTSTLNTGELSPEEVVERSVPLSALATKAHAVGENLGADYLRGALLYQSPYLRTRQTMARILEGAGIKPGEVRIFEDPRLCEVDHGYSRVDAQREMQALHGSFYYRFKDGESPNDCFNRLCTFLDSMNRQVKRMKRDTPPRKPNVVIVSHGLTITCFVMRFLHLTVEQFESMNDPDNCDVITLAKVNSRPTETPLFTCGKWGVWGMRLRSEGSSP